MPIVFGIGMITFGSTASEVDVKHINDLYINPSRNVMKTNQHNINVEILILISLIGYKMIKAKIKSKEYNDKNDAVYPNK